MKFFGKYWVILILCLVVIGMATVKTKFGFKGKYVVEIVPQPTEIPKPTLVPGFEVLNFLPYQGVGFVVDRYLGPNELAVQIKGIDKKLAEKMVFEWMKENKVATESYKLKIE
ncbi:MAG: hypothetical protein NTY75_04110 [Candidatus Shapirobacteria bacterium]|nr:hypothetical protein [Candidatus Shapirobacteria bacterium]